MRLSSVLIVSNRLGVHPPERNVAVQGIKLREGFGDLFDDSPERIAALGIVGWIGQRQIILNPAQPACRRRPVRVGTAWRVTTA